MNEKEDLKRRATVAATQYLDRRGCEILDVVTGSPGADVVFREGDVLAFAEVLAGYGDMPEEESGREKQTHCEKFALGYLADYDDVDIEVRFDVITCAVIASDRCLLRHHRNRFGGEREGGAHGAPQPSEVPEGYHEERVLATALAGEGS